MASSVEKPRETTSAQLSSVRLLLSSDRDVKTYDLLLATTFEYLDGGPKTDVEIQTHLLSVWPGLKVSREIVVEMLSAARESGYVSPAESFGSRSAWTLGDRGRLDVAGSRQWAEDILTRTAAEVEREATDYFGSCDSATSGRWTELLLDAISSCLVAGISSQPVNVTIVGSELLSPATVDLAVVDARLCELVSEMATLDFLRSLARMAVDPSAVFGTELIHTLTLAYVLHSFAAGYDNLAARQTVGSLEQEVLVLDTPVLLQLCGPARAVDGACQ